ncbi:MAG: sensor histidine kinase [Candidatus Saccharimonadota bacterium]
MVSPNLEALSVPSTHWDVVAYATILSVFALVSWLSGSQVERSLKRARDAEARLRVQKENLVIELAEESRLLRQSELQQIRQLHKFALLGQSTAATLHELSNHLSILNFDIEDMRQQRDRSSAIARAQNSVEHINNMVRQSRKYLDTYDTPTTFSALRAINQTVTDLKPKFSRRNISLTKTSHGSGGFLVTGSSMALMQIITILLNNAIDACYDSSDPSVSIDIVYTRRLLKVSIQDSGPGISAASRKSLFEPQQSSKPSGLGVGLYIARNLARHQFNGDIALDTQNPRTTFILEIPRREK